MSDNNLSDQLPMWRGLFDWSMNHSDGTRPASNVKQMDPERYAFLSSALQHYVVDLPKRLKEIKLEMDVHLERIQSGSGAEGLASAETLMDELLEIVHDLDYARDLHSIGGLDMLLRLLQCPEASLRWRAAEAVGTCVQNNQKVQRVFQEGGVLPILLRLLSDPDATVITKALYALGSLVRNNREGLAALRAAAPHAALVGALKHADVRVVRKSVQMVMYLLQNSKEDRSAFLAVARAVEGLRCLLASEDTDIRLAALQSLFSLLRDPASRAVVVGDAAGWGKLKELVDALGKTHAGYSSEDQETFREEITACKVLHAVLTKIDAS